MPNGMFLAKWKPDLHLQHGISLKNGLLIVQVEEKYRKSLISKLKKLDEWQEKKALRLQDLGEDPGGAIREIEFKWAYYYQRRTLNQNRLLWSLYKIEAYILNSGMSGHRDQNITPNQLYEDDLAEYGERETVKTKRKNLSWYMENYYIESILSGEITFTTTEAFHKLKDFEQLIEITYIKGTSRLNTKEMAVWIERLFNRIAYQGVPLEKADEIKDFWIQQRGHLNRNKIVINDELMFTDDYQEKVQICEATGEFIGNGEGILVPICEDLLDGKRSYGWNWLHISETAYLVWKNENSRFLKQYPHLKNKVGQALDKCPPAAHNRAGVRRFYT